MNVLIVYAHPEPLSLTGSLKTSPLIAWRRPAIRYRCPICTP